MKIYHLFWPVAFIFSIIFNLIGVPAPWLLGALTAGIIYSLSIRPVQTHRNVFTMAQAFIGVSLGSMLDIAIMYQSITSYFFSIIFALVATLSLGGTLGYVLYKRTNLDFKTSMYSFIPGGASEVLGLAQSDHADIRIVAAFHSVRMILFISVIPLFVGTGAGGNRSSTLISDLFQLQDSALPIILIIIAALLLSKFLPIPAAALFYSTLLMVVYSLFDPMLDVPMLVAGFGQMLIGGSIGLRFDVRAFKLLWEIKSVSVTLMSILIVATVLISVVFSLWSHVDIWSSILSWVPAGAGEMASTAIFLELDETSVISIQLIRLYTVFLSLPLIVKLLNKYSKAT